MSQSRMIRISLAAAGERVSRTVDAQDGATYAEVLRSRGLNPQAVLVFVDGRPRPMDAPVGDGEKVDVLPVFSGG